MRDADAERCNSVQGVSRHFGDVKAVDGVTLEMQDGEFFSMLGPSGSGKTTCLRMIAGFDRPTAGRIVLYGQDVSNLPPYERPVNTVFQDYALFPHMTVDENIAYGLMIKKVAEAERTEARGRDAGTRPAPGLWPSQASAAFRRSAAACCAGAGADQSSEGAASG